MDPIMEAIFMQVVLPALMQMLQAQGGMQQASATWEQPLPPPVPKPPVIGAGAGLPNPIQEAQGPMGMMQGPNQMLGSLLTRFMQGMPQQGAL